MASRRVVNGGTKRALVLGAAVLAVLPLSGHGEARIFVGDVMQQPGGNAGDPQGGVYVRDSAIAADKFELGKRMERLKEWHKSADVYQEILKKHKESVVPTNVNEKGNADRYASVVVAVQDRLSKWPEEGLVVYRNRFEPEAAALLEQAKANDVATLHQVFAAYFVSDSAKAAGIRMMDLYMEAGEFAAAAWIGDRLLELHPNLKAERGQVLYRTVTAFHLTGNKEAAEKRATELKTHFGNELAVVAGVETKLGEVVDRQLAEPPPALAGLAADSYPTIHGDASRSQVTAGGGRPGALVHSTKLPGPVTLGMQEQIKMNVSAAHANAVRDGMTIGVIPAVDRGELFFQDGQRVYALHVESGVPLPGWSQTYSTRMGQYWLPGNPFTSVQEPFLQLQLRAPRQHTLTLTDDAVLAVMGIPDVGAMLRGVTQGANQGGTKLVCLDRASGKVRWTADPNSMPNNQGNPKNLAFSGSPLVVGDNTYVIARGSGGAGVEDCHVSCYELASGKFKWSCYIASSQTGVPMNNWGGGGPQMPSTDTVSHLGFASGRVFVNTNLGAVAAVDAYSGATAWLSIYPRPEIFQGRGRMAAFGWNGGGVAPTNQDTAKPWEFNPVIASDGKVFVLPTDGKFIHIYDIGSGEEFKRIPNRIQHGGDEPRHTEEVKQILGVSGEHMMLASETKVYYVNWKTYKPKGADGIKLDMDSTVWMSQFERIKGRPFLTQQHLLVPLEKALAVVDLKRGKVLERFPKGSAAWPDGAGPGNVVVTRDHVIVAGAEAVNVYTDLEGVRSKYETAVRNDPNNVEARLVFSELMFNARQLEEAVKVLDDAIGVLGGLEGMRAGEHRERVFSDAVMFAGKLAGDRVESSDEVAEELYDRAAKAALTPSQHVHYRLSRAQFLDSRRDRVREDYVKAVRLYQEILSSPEMRIISRAKDDGTGTLQAGEIAEKAISELVRQQGPSVYEAFEKEAAESAAKVGAEGDPGKMLAVAENYPNSKVARQAMLGAAAAYEKAGQARMANQVLRRLYWKYRDVLRPAERTQLLESMARNQLAVGNTAAALGRLLRVESASRETPLTAALTLADGTALKRPDGKDARTVAEAAAALAALAQKKADGAVPAVNLPPRLTVEEKLAGKKRPDAFLKPGADAVIAGVQALVEPPADLGHLARTDRVLAQSGGKLACYPAGKNQPLWTSDAPAEGAKGCVWLDKKLLVWGENDVLALEPEKGTVLWRVDLRGLPAVDLVPGGGEPAPVAQAEPPAQEEILLGGGVAARRRILLDAQGRVPVPVPLPQPAEAPKAPEAADGKERLSGVRPLTDRLVLSTTTGRIAALNLADGNPLWQTRLAVSQPSVLQTLASDDFVAVRWANGPAAGAQTFQLVALDSYNGQQLFRHIASTTQGTAAMNCALGDDGTLVWTTQTAMLGKDLYEPGESPSWNRGGSYNGMTWPEHLVVSGRHVLALRDGGRYIERRALASGDSAGNPLMTNGNDGSIRIRLAGPRLYAVGQHSMMAYHTEHDTTAKAQMRPEVVSQPAEAMLARDFVLLPGSKDQPQTFALNCYSRDLIVNKDTKKATESVLLAHSHDFAEPAGVKAWQVVDGGVYYLAGDERLVFLRENRE